MRTCAVNPDRAHRTRHCAHTPSVNIFLHSYLARPTRLASGWLSWGHLRMSRRAIPREAVTMTRTIAAPTIPGPAILARPPSPAEADAANVPARRQADMAIVWDD